ncbi:MAG: M23 family peptidase, partial [Acidobacteriota bacterium]
MIRGKGLLTVLSLIVIGAAQTAGTTEGGIELAYPLPADLPATASFGEYRPGHLHAGLDFSTGGELGWPVRAAAAGEVFRLKVEPRGYGRAVYVRHPDGF